MTRRNINTILRPSMLAITAAIFVFAGPAQMSGWSGQRWAALGSILAVSVVLLELGVPFPAFRNFGRREGDAGRINLDIPLYVLTFAVFGWFATAALSFLGTLLSPTAGRKYVWGERLFRASARVPFFLAAGALRLAFAGSYVHYSAAGFAAFFAMNMLWIAALIVLWSDPLTSLRTRQPLPNLWRAHLGDGALWTLLAAQVTWGYVSTQIFIRDGAILGIATVLPLVLFAAILRALHVQRVAVHRLTFARDAVHAMLGARDPLPHINAILSSVHSELLKETLQILRYGGSGGDPWHTVASIGPPPDDAALQVRRHALRGLTDSDRTLCASNSREHSVFAFASRDGMGRLLGVLAVHRTAGSNQHMHRRQFQTAAAALAPLLSDFGSIALTQNAASMDALTGLANRHTILEILRGTVGRVGADGACSIVMLDIDHFKTVNDRLGHQAGDRCLQLIGFVVAGNIRGCDRAGRIGGEEFIVFMPDSGRDVALLIAERLRKAIQDCGFAYADGTPVTASMGIASSRLSDTVETLIERADRALYEAKRGGRNRVAELPA